MKSRRFTTLFVACVLAAVPLTACTKSYQAYQSYKKNRHFTRGDKYFAEGKFKEAALEYRNVLQLEPGSKEATRKLGHATYGAGDLVAAATFLELARQQDPADMDVRLKLGSLYLTGGDPAKAWQLAQEVLAKEPDNFIAVGLLTDAAQSPAEVDQAIATLQDRPDRFKNPNGVARALGLLFARKKDTPHAEEALRASIAAAPDSPDAHSTLARLHLSKGELEQGEKEFREAARLAPAGSRYQLELADFLITTGRNEAARTVLEEITRKAPTAYEAWIRIADLALREKRLDDCARACDVILKGEPNNTSALLFKARVELARGDTKQALETATKAVRTNDQLPMGHYVLAMAQSQAGNLSLARTAADEAVTRAPRFAEAVSLAAELASRSGDTQAAAQLLRTYSENVPADPRPHLQLGSVLLQANDVAHARESFQKFASMAPSDARGPMMLGLVARQSGNLAEARRHFEQALSLDAGYADPLAQLVEMSFRDKQPVAALELAKKQARLAPASAEVAFVHASAALASGQKDEAEQEFLRVIQLKPENMASYRHLAGLYGSAKDYKRATAIVDQALAKDADNAGMLMLSAALSQMQGNVKQARETYEKILARQPKFAPAANNLAYLLAEEGKDLTRARTLAQTARDAAPADPDVADTLGFVLFKQGAHPGALALFKESLEKRPNSPDVLVHLALAHKKLLDQESAEAALRKALALNPNVAGGAEAKRVLENKQ